MLIPFMPNVATRSNAQGCALSEVSMAMDIHQGDQINLLADQNTYQVIGVDGDHNRCWIRRWPIDPKGGSPVFEISLQQIAEVDG